ncbi:MAG: hypothetical protein H0X24_12855 [Ktedonobacterales bacterium]|nr:hypothetical protein [Ktedonobacterales bacterium]
MTEIETAQAPPAAVAAPQTHPITHAWERVRSLAIYLWSIQALRTALGTWAATRALLCTLTWLGVLLQTNRTNLSDGHAILSATDFLNHWWIWDGGWYIIIGQGGYQQPGEIGFFPLYPLLIHGGVGLFHAVNPILIAMLVSNLGTLLAFIAIALLVSFDDASDTAPRYALRALAAYPFALYLFAPYSEGVFLAGAAWALLAARRGWWPLAMLAAALAGVTRPFGVVLALPLLWEYGRQVGWWAAAADLWRWRHDWRGWLRDHPATRDTAARLIIGMGMVLAAPAGIGIYAMYCWHAYGNPLMFIAAQQQYNEHNHSGVIEGIFTATQQWFGFATSSYPQARWLLDVVPLLACTLFTFATIRRIPFAYTLYCAGVCLVCFATPSIDAIFPDVYVSAGRYMLVAIPLFVWLGRWTRERAWLETLLIQGGWAVQVLLVIFLFNGGWLV